MNCSIWSGYRSFVPNFESWCLDHKHKINIGLVCIFQLKLSLLIITRYQYVFITNGVKFIDHHIRLWSPIKDIKNEHPHVINLVSLKFKEYTQSRLYQIRLNSFKPYIDLSNTQYMLCFMYESWVYEFLLGSFTNIPNQVII